MATAGGTPQVRSCAGFLAIGLVVAGCGDRHLTAILPAPVDHTTVPPDMTTPEPDSCSAPPRASVPPMGWNGWNAFRCRPELDQTKFMANVDALVASGMKDAGYRYANLDDCWQTARNSDGLVAANERFPDGIAGLARYAHARGLKLGLDAHIGECQRAEMTTPSSQGYEQTDAATFADWGVDYVKYARCASDADDAARFGMMRAALDATRRPMVFGLVASPFQEWQAEVAQQWRTHADIEPSWDAILDIIDTNAKLAAYAGQGGFNDADMLWVGFSGLTESESRAHFSMWALMASPLLAGNDLTAMSETTAALLTNREIIALDQDGLGLQGVQLEQQGAVGVYAKPLGSCGARGVVLLNRGDQAADARVTLTALGLAPGPAVVRDLWMARDLDVATDSLTLSVPPHDVRALRITGSEPPLPRGSVFISDLSWTYAANGWGPVERDQELGDMGVGDGLPLMLGGNRYAKGLGTNSPSLVRYRLGKACQTFSAEIGIDDLTGDSGSAVFQVWADGEKLYDSGIMLGSAAPRHVDVDVGGRSEIRLFVSQVEDYGMDHADWADARLLCSE